MDSNAVTISELISGMLFEARRLGLSEPNIWRDWEPKANSLAMYYRRRGLCVYSSEVTEEYLNLCEQRYEAGELAYSTLHQIRQILRRIHEYYVTGTLRKTGNMPGFTLPSLRRMRILPISLSQNAATVKIPVTMWLGL